MLMAMRLAVFVLGVSNGAYAIAAIGSMMSLAAEGTQSREGVRMGLWGAAQAIAFGMGGLLGTLAADFARWLLQQPAAAYGAVFILEAFAFLAAAAIARNLGATTAAGIQFAAPANRSRYGAHLTQGRSA